MGAGLTDPGAEHSELIGRWRVEWARGSASELFDEESASTLTSPTVRVLTVRAPTIVLGSSQSANLIDEERCRSSGVDVVRRRSGGGAVWLDEDMVWVDVFVPAGDSRWDADVGRSMWWIGETWAVALQNVGVSGARVHRGALMRTAWSPLVCFAGLGAGEVCVGAGKTVGISQRRTRAGALMQCGLLRRWNPDALVDSLAHLDDGQRGELRSAVATAGVGVADRADLALAAFLSLLATDHEPLTPNLSDR